MASTYTVNTTGDGGDVTPGDDACATSIPNCSLRAAIQEANAHTGADTIGFSIGSGTVTISPSSPLPVVTNNGDVNNTLAIDGTTQPGFAGTPIVRLDGCCAGTGADGLTIGTPLTQAFGSSVRGLAITFFGGAAIRSSCSGNITIARNYIGTSFTGNSIASNASGILVEGGAIGACAGSGSGYVIGGPNAGDGNVISASAPGTGIQFNSASTGSGLFGFNNTIQANLIGVAADGTTALGNGGYGILMDGAGNNLITGNTIANNGSEGIFLVGSTPGTSPPSSNKGFQVTQNSIYSNAGGLGIDLYPDPGVNPNDGLDGDGSTDVNALQNFPHVDAALDTGAISGELFSNPSTSYRLEFFSSPACDSSGFGEGKTYLGSTTVSTNAAGTASFSASPGALTLGHAVTATATVTSAGDTVNSTSEFSPCRTVTSATPPLRTLTVSTPGLGSGTVLGPGINCGNGNTDCSEDYGDGMPIRLVASAVVPATFDGWGGDCAGTGPCDLTVSPGKSVTATFTLPPKTLTVNQPANGTITGTGINCGSGAGENDCSETYPGGTVVDLSQTAKPGFAFGNWAGDCSGSGACQVTMTADHTVGAAFAAVHTLTVGRAGTGTGTVTGPGINCGSGAGETDCSESYADGTAVALSAGGSGGSTFAGWSGDCSGSGACNLTMSADRGVTAAFDAAQVVVDLVPPETVIDSGPSKAVKKKATFAFHATETATFECSVDGTAAKRAFTCTSPFTTPKLKRGKHTFSVRSRDAAGNVDPSPPTRTFKVKRKKRRR